MRKKLWAAILMAGVLGITGITAFAVPEKVTLEKELFLFSKVIFHSK